MRLKLFKLGVLYNYLRSSATYRAEWVSLFVSSVERDIVAKSASFVDKQTFVPFESSFSGVLFFSSLLISFPLMIQRCGFEGSLRPVGCLWLHDRRANKLGMTEASTTSLRCHLSTSEKDFSKGTNVCLSTKVADFATIPPSTEETKRDTICTR